MDIAFKLDPDEADIEAVRKGLIAFNRAQRNDAPSGYQPFALHLKTDGGAIVGGLTGMALLDWLVIDLFFVDAAYRGQDHGTRLMQRAEEFARERGLVGIWLDTFAFQARPFYEKLGFSVFGELVDHPRGSRRYFMQKRLAPAA